MAMYVESFVTSIGGVVHSLVYILIIIPLMIGLFFLVLWAVKNRRYIYSILIYRDLGNGKSLWIRRKAGYFKSGKSFFGLMDRTGEERLETKGGWNKPIQIIESTSDNDMIDIDFKKGFMCMQKADDRKILVPIHSVSCSNLELITTIAAADFRDSANRILQRNERELQTNWEKYQPMIAMLVLGIIMLIMLVMVMQFATGAIDTSWANVKLAQAATESAKATATALPSVAP